jgi:hypothetical protein
MKTKKIELDVDFIGGQTSLTKEEEKTISDFIKKNKSKKTKSLITKTKATKQLIYSKLLTANTDCQDHTRPCPDASSSNAYEIMPPGR